MRDSLAIAGWSELDDLTAVETREQMRALLRETYTDRRAAVLNNWTGQLWRFVRLIQPGDFLIVPVRSRGELAIGRVAGPYEYRADAAPGFRHVRPLTWLRPDLPKKAVLPDLHSSLGSLLTVFELSKHNAVDRVAHLAAEGWDPGDPDGGVFASRDQLLERAADENTTEAPRLTIRKLLALWGAGRRTAGNVAEIEKDLTERGLTTRPAFTEGWIDNEVELVPVSDEPDSDTKLPFAERTAADSEALMVEEPPAVSLRIGDLEAANGGVFSVKDTEALVTATTHMLVHDYSQLAVVHQGGAVRAVSWESIAKAGLGNAAATLAEAVVPVRIVDYDADLLDHIREIYDIGYVLVRGPDRVTISGIVTTADLTLQFAQMARPIAMIEEVERRLRRRVDEVFELAEIRAATKWPNKTHSAADLNLGAYKHLLADQAAFDKLGWRLDRDLFVGAVEAVREVRNELMHFSTDPLTDGQMKAIRSLVGMLRTVDPRP